MLNIPDESLKAAYRSYLRGLWSATRRNCPPTADLIRFFSARSPRRFKMRVLDHVARCGACAEEFEILMGMDRQARAFSSEVARLRTPSGTVKNSKSSKGFLGSGRWLLASAGLAAVFLVLLLRLSEPGVAPDGVGMLRSAAPAEIIPEVPSGKVDTTAPLVFRWRFSGGKEEGATCVVFLYDDSLLQIWESPTSESQSCVLPREIQKSLVSGRTYFWGVSAAPGSACRESDLVPFSVGRLPPP